MVKLKQFWTSSTPYQPGQLSILLVRGITMVKSLVYCRVSSERQVNEGHGLDSQEKRCRDYAKSKGYDVAGVFRDEGESGGLFERTAMRELLKCLEKMREPERVVVVFDDLKRFARDTEVHFGLKREIYGRNGRVECPNFTFEDSPGGKFVETVMAASAELERNQNRQQVIQKQKARIESGYWSFCPPRGLAFIKDPGHGKLLSPVEPWATIIKQAIEGYANGLFLTLNEVRDSINSEVKNYGIDHKVSIESIRRMLTQILYTGYVEYKPWEVPLRSGHHKGFITLETYNRVQDILNGRSKPRLRKDYNLDFPLRRLVVCSSCQKPLTGSWNTGRSKRYANYFCKTSACAMRYKSVPKARIEGDFASILEKVAISEEVVGLAKEVLNDVWNQRKQASDSHREATERQIQGIDIQMANLVSRVAKVSNNELVMAYEKQIENLASQKGQFRTDLGIENYSSKEFGTALDIVMSALSNPLSVWNSDRFEDKQTIVYMYFDGKLSYQKDLGFGTVNLEPSVALIQKLGDPKRDLVEVVGIEPTSEIVIIKHLQAYLVNSAANSLQPIVLNLFRPTGADKLHPDWLSPCILSRERKYKMLVKRMLNEDS